MKALRPSPLASMGLALLVAAGCAPGSDSAGVPPLSEDIDLYDPYLATRIREAHGALVAEPERVDLWMSLGMTYEANALSRQALTCYREALAREENAKTWSRMAQAHAELGELQQAAESMQRSVNLDPGYAPSFWRLGSYHFDLGQFDEARAAYGRATELDPDHVGGWTGLARLLLQENQAEKAVELLEGVLERKPDDATCRRLLRTAYIQAGQAPGEAKASWSRMTSMGKDPWHREFREYQERPLMQRALADLSSGRPEEAVKALEPFAEENPRDLNARSYLAWGYYLVGRRGDAERTLREALAQDADNISVLRVQSQIHELEGDARGAIEVLKRIVATDPNEMDALESLGRLQREQGQHADAVATLSQLLALNQRHGDAWWMKGASQLALGERGAAHATFRAAIENRVRDEQVYLALAEGLEQEGRVAEALEVLSGAPKLSPTGQRALEALRAKR